MTNTMPMMLEEQFGAHNYHPLPIVLAKGEGVWVEDPEGNRYMDMLSAYSALNHGHRHPKVIQALKDQADKITLTSRAFYNDKLGLLYERLAKVTNKNMILPMNTGAEAVETAIKAIRRWAYDVKKVPVNQAEIIVASGNFHGRTTTIVSFSSDQEYQRGFGPLTPGFRIVPYGDLEALQSAIAGRDVNGLDTWTDGRDVIDVVGQYPVKGLSAQSFTDCLRPLPPRRYSIASSLLAAPGEVHLTVAAVRYSSHGRERMGVASTFLADRIAVGRPVPIFIEPNAEFRLPEDSGQAMIMIGAGTGVAADHGEKGRHAATGERRNPQVGPAAKSHQCRTGAVPPLVVPADRRRALKAIPLDHPAEVGRPSGGLGQHRRQPAAGQRRQPAGK